MAQLLAKLTFMEYGTICFIIIIVFMIGIVIGTLDND